ncbi:hypothetical protein [Wolbachia endosymbiont (group B) of Dolichovespula media]|uniref:hypothetical protein n=1 Tax=Wolbachia endosymbiont (group B) of Dolichovespula media TaxID=2954001 RepID=UPI0021F91E5E|nr:hypothetical protein [Wolbachia endosymbiont (group B) of Dolichovespula media]
MSFDKLEEILASIDTDVGLSESNVFRKVEEKLKQIDTIVIHYIMLSCIEIHEW